MLKISKDFSLSDEAAFDVTAIVGRRGRGKTTTAVVLTEKIYAQGGRFVIADPVGVWWGLKSARDGKHAGLPVVVMGGEHADVPLEETAGRIIADFVLEPSSPSVILDFRGFRKNQMTRFMVDFLEQLYHKNRSPLHVILDEADQFAPQRVMGETARLVGAAEDVCKMGRARGLFPILITQRPAALNKNVLTQAGLLIAHQLTGPQDRKALDEWIRANAEEREREKFLSTIATLKKGEAWFWQPENSVFQLVKVSDRETYDSSATPTGTATKQRHVTMASVDLDELKQRIAATIEKAKLTDPKELQRQIAELKKQLSAKADQPEAVSVLKIPVLKDGQLKRIEGLLDNLRMLANCQKETMEARMEPAIELANKIEAALKRISGTPQLPTSNNWSEPRWYPPRKKQSALSVSPSENIEITRPQQRILDSLASMEAFGIQNPKKPALAAHARVSPNSGGYNNNLSALKTAALINYPMPGHVSLTEKGRSMARDPEPMTGSDLHDGWRAILSGPQCKILNALIDIYPKSISKNELAERIDVSGTSGGYNNNLSHMRSMGCIDYPDRGLCRAADILWKQP